MPPADVGPLALRQAAAAGDPAALFEVAVRYTEGNGVQPDLSEALKYYEKAAARGLAPAQYRLGSLYEKGRGTTKDLDLARMWYGRAADQGNAKATHNLAVLYAEGIDGNPDFEKAAGWFLKAADFGVRDSQYNLGILYARGLGVEKNLVDSYKWFALAAKQGDNDAAKKRDEVANMLSETELAEARLAADTWKRKPLLPAANEVTVDPAWAASTDTVSQAVLPTDPGLMIRRAQRLLNDLGYDAGEPDGRIGPRTREAIKAFQKMEGMPVTGEIDIGLMQALEGRPI